jgi:hypothetical protein
MKNIFYKNQNKKITQQNSIERKMTCGEKIANHHFNSFEQAAFLFDRFHLVIIKRNEINKLIRWSLIINFSTGLQELRVLPVPWSSG